MAINAWQVIRLSDISQRGKSPCVVLGRYKIEAIAGCAQGKRLDWDGKCGENEEE